MLRKKNITLNDRKASGSETVALGDKIKFWFSDETFDKFHKDTLIDASALKKPDIIYEDNSIIIMNKPAGVLSQKSGPDDISINEQMIGWLLSSGQYTNEELQTFRPSVCNRLDRNTSGIITGGKTLSGLRFLSEGFRQRTIHKYYFCLVAGHVTGRARLCGYLVKNRNDNRVTVTDQAVHNSDYIETEYEPLALGDECSLLKVFLITGRTHQIRAHLSSAGHPVIGDLKYGNSDINDRFRSRYGVRRQLLHAGILKMPDRDHLEEYGELSYLCGRTWTAPPPDDFLGAMEGDNISWNEEWMR